VAVGAAVLLSQMLAVGQLEIPMVVAGVILGLALFDKITLTQWCVLLLLSSVVSRTLVVVAGLPAILNFVHYPIAFGMGLASLRYPRDPQSSRSSPGAWILGLLVLSLISLLAAFSHPVRAVVFLVILGEPLVVMFAIHRWAPGTTEHLDVLKKTCIALLAVEIAVGLWQGLSAGWGDDVKGTLMDQSAGAHVLAGLFAIGVFLILSRVLAGRMSRGLGLVMSGAMVAMILAADARQVLLTMAAGVVAIGVLGRPGVRAGLKRVSDWSLGRAVMALAVAAVSLFVFEQIFPGSFERARDLADYDELAEVQLIEARGGEPVTLIFGSGPGTSGSRASLLLTPGQFKEDSPLAALDLPPTELGLEIAAESRSQSFGGSSESAASTSLGILGDLGLVGFFAMAYLFVRLWFVLGRGGWLSTAARGALIMTAGLIFVDNWLEYPEFAVPLAVLGGLALRESRFPASSRVEELVRQRSQRA
jgi:hypothetical protein